MRLTLPSGRPVELFITHRREPLQNKWRKTKHNIYEMEEKRETEVVLKVDGGEYKGVAKCHPLDQFNKEEGRKQALKKALEETKIWANAYDYLLSKQDRKYLWQTVLPKRVKA